MVLTIPDVENLSLSSQVLTRWLVEVLEYYKSTFGLVFGQMIQSGERVIENKEKKPNSAQLQQKSVGYNAARPHAAAFRSYFSFLFYDHKL